MAEKMPTFVAAVNTCGAAAPTWLDFLNGFLSPDRVTLDYDRKRFDICGGTAGKVRARVCCVTGKIWTVTGVDQWMNPAMAEEVAQCLLVASVASQAVTHFKPLA